MLREKIQLQQPQEMLRAKLNHQIPGECFPIPILRDQLPQNKEKRWFHVQNITKKYHVDATADKCLSLLSTKSKSGNNLTEKFSSTAYFIVTISGNS